jgi:hypothetical protein
MRKTLYGRLHDVKGRVILAFSAPRIALSLQGNSMEPAPRC